MGKDIHALTNSSGTGDTPPRATLSAPEALAEWLLAQEAGAKQSSDELAAAGERAYLRLRARLAVLLGATGFDALWARATHVAQQKLRARGDAAAAGALSPDAYGLHDVVHGHDAAMHQQVLLVAFTSFIRLLFTFIGEELGTRFIRQLWPDLPADTRDSQAEEATP
jgi:hypothetical protein